MRILLIAHHRLEPGAGVADATLQLAGAMRALGHAVDVWGHAEAFGHRDPTFARMRFPFRVATQLRRAADQYDVVDATTGDARRWLGQRRGSRPLIVTRAHGLEQVADAAFRAHTGRALSFKYRVYSGGYRLWEVRKSIQLADGAIVLNGRDAAYVRDQFHVAADRIACIANGLPAALLGVAPPDRITSVAVPLKIAFIGSWIPRKGTAVVTATLNALAAQRVDFRATLLGTGAAAADVLAPMSADVRGRTEVVPSYTPSALSGLLAGAHLLLHPSWSEGFSLALAEGMACGLAPIVTPAGAAHDLVRDGESGVWMRADAADCAAAVTALDRDRDRLHSLRVGAQSATTSLAWPRIAAETIAFYKQRIASAVGKAS